MDSDSDGTIILNSDEEVPMDLEDAQSLEDVNELRGVNEEENVNEEPAQSLLNLNEVGVTDIESKSKDEPVSELVPKETIQCNNDSINDDDGTMCPICLDSWANFGEHRVCSLKCGHLFGLNCIERWFTQKQRTCPTCKKKAVKSHIRHIYARKLIAIDTSEYENIKKQLEDVTEKNNRLQIEVTQGVCREHLLLQQVVNLKREVKELNMKIEVKDRYQSQSQQSTRKTVRMYMDKCLEVCKDAGCRVLDHYARQDLIVVTAKSPNVLFQGFGVRKITISTYKPTSFIPLHSKSIRDLSVHPQNPWLLSVSLDKTLKIVDLSSNNSISGYTKGEVPLWACCWDFHNLNMMYIGSQQGSVLKFDLRYMTDPVSILDIPGDMSPVVSLASVRNTSFINSGGIVVCKLNSLWAFKNESDERLPIPMEGPFISMKYQNSTNHILLSTRSNSQYPYSRHLVCTIENGCDNNLLCNVVHCFPGSPTQKYMSRSCFVQDFSDCFIAAHQESNKSVFLWSINSGQKVCSVPAHDPVLDLCGFSVGNNNFVASLTERKVEFFKFI